MKTPPPLPNNNEPPTPPSSGLSPEIRNTPPPQYPSIILIIAAAALWFVVTFFNIWFSIPGFILFCAACVRFFKKKTAFQSREADLARWQHVADAQREADAILEKAMRVRIDADAESSLKLKQAAIEAKEEKERITAKSRDNEAQTLDILRAAQADAAATMEKARKQALKITNGTYGALKEKDELERIATAMRNQIEGYGDRYLIPRNSILDALAEHFGKKEAGQKLALARHITRSKIQAGIATISDSGILKKRNHVAERFILDAFNTKIDALLSESKNKNQGVLEQEAKAAYVLLNQEGKAFGGARITAEYLASRLEEIRWACAIHLLSQKEREEQKQIKERMREEERARKEYENAQKQAENEEKTLRDEIERARREMSAKLDDEISKAKYEKQISLLAEKLAQAEAKATRAKSMAQQTRAGYVYIISNIGSFGENVFKIGMTRRLEPHDRIDELGGASVPFEFDVHALIYSEDAPALETSLHTKLATFRVNAVNVRREFFRITPLEIKSFIESEGINAEFTLAAEASEYRETQRLAQLNEKNGNGNAPQSAPILDEDDL